MKFRNSIVYKIYNNKFNVEDYSLKFNFFIYDNDYSLYIIHYDILRLLKNLKIFI